MLYTYLELSLLLLAGLTTVSLYVVIPYLLLLLLPNIGSLLEKTSENWWWWWWCQYMLLIPSSSSTSPSSHLLTKTPLPKLLMAMAAEVEEGEGEGEGERGLIKTLTDKLRPDNFEIVPRLSRVEEALQLLLEAEERRPGLEYLRYLLKKALAKSNTRAAYMQYILVALDFLQDLPHHHRFHHRPHHPHPHRLHPHQHRFTNNNCSIIKDFLRVLKTFKSTVLEPDYIARTYQLRGFKLLRKDWRWKRLWLAYPSLQGSANQVELLIREGAEKAKIIAELGNIAKFLKGAQLSSTFPEIPYHHHHHHHCAPFLTTKPLLINSGNHLEEGRKLISKSGGGGGGGVGESKLKRLSISSS